MSVLAKIMFGINFPKRREDLNDQNDSAANEVPDNIDSVLNQGKLKFVDDLRKVHEDKQLNKFALAMLTYMKKSKVKTVGDRVALPCPTLESLENSSKLSPELLSRFKSKFGFACPTPIQALSIPNILEKRNYVGIAPTGSGKTLSYLLPMCQLLKDKPGSRALIVAPTFELSVQIYKVCIQLIGKTSPLFNIKISHIQKMEEPIDSYDLLISTPQKFLSLAETDRSLSGKFEIIVLDEADKFFELCFMPQLEQLFDLFKVHETQYILVSATLPTGIEKLVNAVFVDKTQVVIGGKVNVLSTIEQKLVYCATEEGKLYELENIINSGELKVPCVIFAQSKERVHQIYQVMKKMKIYASYLSAELSYQARENKVKEFEAGKIWVLITTDLLARGMDFPALKMVINFDIPTSTVTYIHRVGRTGRAGKPGTALTFYTNEDKLLVRKLADLLRQSNCQVPEWIFTIEKGQKRELKQLITKPQSREDIGSNKRVKFDHDFHNAIRRKDYEYYKNHQPEASDGKGLDDGIEIEETEEAKTHD